MPPPCARFCWPAPSRGARARTCRAYDKDGSGAIEPPELAALLADFGLLEGMGAREAAAAAEAHMRAADKEGAGALGPEAFARCAGACCGGARRLRGV